MTQFYLWSGRVVCAGLLAGGLGATIAATAASAAPAPAAVAPSDDDTGIARYLNTELAYAFALQKDIALDPALREAAGKISKAHLDRMQGQLLAWVQEERGVQRAAGEKAKDASVSRAVFVRMLNELAYWHIEPGDAEYEKATLAVLKASPQVCRTGDEARFVDFSSRILRIQAMPPAQRQAALAMEARLLERWGKPRPAPLPWPHPLPQDAAMDVVKKILAGGQRPAVALAPILSWRLLSERERYEQMPRETRCGLQRWWLEMGLAQGQSPAAVLNAFRYGTLVTARYRFGPPVEPADGKAADEAPGEDSGKPATGKPAYPKFAQRYEVEGVTTIAGRFDPSGKPEHASVIDRKITVAGIRGLRPIAFEDSFDSVSVQHALKVGPVKPGDTPKPMQMVWSLEPREQPANQVTPQEKK